MKYKDFYFELLNESYTIQYDGSYKVKDPDDVMGEKTVETKQFRMEDSVGGRLSGYVMNNDTVYIVMMQSIPPNTPFEDSEKYKRRGFFKGALQEFKKQGIKHVVINLQSQDTRGAIQKLLASGILKNPRDMRGGSFDEHPTKFDII